MDSKVVNREIRRRIWPLLKDIGFSQFSSRSAWRNCDNKIDVLNFKSFNSSKADTLGVTTFSFGVNLGAFLKYVPAEWPVKLKNSLEMPREYECHLRGKLKRSITALGIDYDDIWSIDQDGKNLLWCINDVAEQLPIISSWFDRLADKHEVLNIILNEKDDWSGIPNFGSNRSPMRSYLAGYVALSVGNHELSREKLGEAVRSNCFTALFHDVDSAISRAT